MVTGSNLLWMDDKTLDGRMKDMRNLGVTWLRVDFNWSAIQPYDRDTYNWRPYDRVVQAAKKHNLKILGTLTYTPIWARSPRCIALTKTEQSGQKCQPISDVDFGRFARASVIRYRYQNIRAWEIWNEPNLNGYWKSVNKSNVAYVDPVAYARVANAAAKEIRNHDKTALVLTGGLAPMFESIHPLGMRQSDYLAKLLPKLNPKLFDAVGIHPYSWPKLPSTPADYNAFHSVDKGRPKYNLRYVMQRVPGWDKKQLWATEFGASTRGERQAHPSGVIKKNARPDHVSEGVQAKIIEQGIKGWRSKRNVGPLFVYADTDRWLPAHKNEGGFGLRRVDGSRKPAYNAFLSSVPKR
jgi:hypothetical protein